MIYYIRDEEGSLIGLKYNNEIYYYIKNMQEDIIGITDSNNNLLCSYLYDSWGNIISIKDNNGNIIRDTSHIGIINPYRYRSYYYDNETKLYYLNSRYYNPEWGRFINADGIIGANKDILGYNLYAYVGNNFVNSSDSNGKKKKSKTWGWFKNVASNLFEKALDFASDIFGSKSYATTPVEGAYSTMNTGLGISAETGTVEVCSIGEDKPITFYSEMTDLTGGGIELNIMNFNINVNSTKYNKSISVSHKFSDTKSYGVTIGADLSKQSIYAKADYIVQLSNNKSISKYIREDVSIFYLIPIPIKSVDFNPFPYVKYAY